MENIMKADGTDFSPRFIESVAKNSFVIIEQAVKRL